MTNPTPEQRAREAFDSTGMTSQGVIDTDPMLWSCIQAAMLTFSQTGVEQAIEACAKVERQGVYVASRASIPERGQMWRNLRASGIDITSSWIDEDGEGQTDDWGELWQRIEREVKSSQALILYAEPDDFPLKGAFVEAGIALASGIPIFIVAPGVELGSYGCRPIGSWASHPLVSYAPSIGAALDAIRATLPAQSPEVNTGPHPITDARMAEDLTYVAHKPFEDTTNLQKTQIASPVNVEGLRKWLRHDGLCGIVGGYGYCTCGLDAALASLSRNNAPLVAGADGMADVSLEDHYGAALARIIDFSDVDCPAIDRVATMRSLARQALSALPAVGEG